MVKNDTRSIPSDAFSMAMEASEASGFSEAYPSIAAADSPRSEDSAPRPGAVSVLKAAPPGKTRIASIARKRGDDKDVLAAGQVGTSDRLLHPDTEQQESLLQQFNNSGNLEPLEPYELLDASDENRKNKKTPAVAHGPPETAPNKNSFVRSMNIGAGSSYRRADGSRPSRRAVDSKAAIREEMNASRSKGEHQTPGAVAVNTSSSKSIGASGDAKYSKAAIREEIIASRSKREHQTPGAVAVNTSSSKAIGASGDAKSVLHDEINVLSQQNKVLTPGVVSLSGSGSSTIVSGSGHSGEKDVIRREIVSLRSKTDPNQPGAVAVSSAEIVSGDSRTARASRKARQASLPGEQDVSSGNTNIESSSLSTRDQKQQAKAKLGAQPNGAQRKTALSHEKKNPPSGQRSLESLEADLQKKESALGLQQKETALPGKGLTKKNFLEDDATKKTIIPYHASENLNDPYEKTKEYEKAHGTIAQLNYDDNDLVAAQVIDEHQLEAEFEAKMMENAVAAEVLTEKDLRDPGRCWKLGCCLLVVIGITLGIAIPLSNDDDPPADPPTMSPTVQAEYDYLFDLVYPISGDVLLNESSPQYQALDWLAFEDPAMLPVKETNSSTLLERYAGASLYFSTQGSMWNEDLNFLSNASVCDWNGGERFGLICDESKYVTGIRINQNNNLNGTLPRELVGFSQLRLIDFGPNNLKGPLPSSLGDLSLLTVIQILFNPELSGPIPSSFSRLVNLRRFIVVGNGLSGTVPANLALNWKQLTMMVLAANDFSGSLPAFPSQSSIAFAAFDDNNFEGTIPDSYFGQSSFETLILINNRLSGSISDQIKGMTALKRFTATNNLFTGEIPSTLGLLEDVEQLDFNENGFSGTIPSQLGRLNNLFQLDLSSNQLTGSLPDELGLLESLETLDISSNGIDGVIPVSFAQLDELATFGLSNTNVVDGLNSVFCTDELMTSNIEAECGGDAPRIACDCCSSCCVDGECNVNLDGVCELSASSLEAAPERGASCNCTEGGSFVSCLETCESCNLDESVCAKSTQYQYTFEEPSIEYTSFRSVLQYTKGRSDTVSFEFEVGKAFCIVEVNGERCDGCQPITCSSSLLALNIDCRNIDGTAPIDTCVDQPVDGANYLELFYWLDLSTVSGCSPLLEFEIGGLGDL